MSQQNVEAFKRFLDGFDRRDIEPMLEEVDAGVEWRPAAPVALGGEATVYRGHAGVPEGIRDLDDSFEELQIEISAIRQPGFVSYAALRSGDGGMTVTVCQDKAGADESSRRAAEWVRENVGPEVNPPAITEGDTVLDF